MYTCYNPWEIALIGPLACLFDSDFKEISDLKGNNTKIKFSKLTEHNINQDYLNVTLRLFESQGWIKRKKNNQEFDIKITENGKILFKELSVYKKFFSFYKQLSELSFLDSEIYQLLNVILDIIPGGQLLRQAPAIILGTIILVLIITIVLPIIGGFIAFLGGYLRENTSCSKTSLSF